MESIVEVEFRLLGKNIEPGKLTEMIGISCTEHEVNSHGLEFWCLLEGSDVPTVDILELCHRVIDPLTNQRKALEIAISKYDLTPDFCVRIYHEPISQLNYGEPGYKNCHLDREIMLFLGAIGAKFYFEFYE